MEDPFQAKPWPSRSTRSWKSGWCRRAACTPSWSRLSIRPAGWSGSTAESFSSESWQSFTSFIRYLCWQLVSVKSSHWRTDEHLFCTSAGGASSTGQVWLISTWKEHKGKINPPRKNLLPPAWIKKNSPTSSLDQTSCRLCKLALLALLLGCKVSFLTSVRWTFQVNYICFLAAKFLF